MENVIQAANVLIDLRRYAEAEKLLREALGRDPRSVYARALLAWAIAFQRRTEEARREAEAAIALDPESPAGYVALGFVLFASQPVTARAALETAIRLAPEEPAYHGMLAQLHLFMDDAPAALAAAERGRAVDPRDIDCATVQAVALMRLGRTAEAIHCAREALSLNPSNAPAHAAHGWSMLAQGQAGLARFHFGQALRIDPLLENAREGLVESLKARWPVYIPLLRAYLWLNRRGRVLRALLVVALFVVCLLLGGLVAGAFPGAAALAMCFVYLPFGLLVMVLGSRQVFDLLLRLDPYARLTLSREQIIASNWVIAGAVSALAALLAWWIAGDTLVAGLVCIVVLLAARLFLGAADPRTRRDFMRPF